MSLIICTLFEGHYHLGLIALTNSLYQQGYRGKIYAGYRGTLPKWSDTSVDNKEFSWEGSKIYKVADGLDLYFLPLKTDYELTNYKPDFMLELINGPSKDAEGIFYFDPDIVVSAPWSFYKEWIKSGVALCEDVNSPLAQNHPRRVAWRNYFSSNGITLNFKDCIYANGGFVGVEKKDYPYLIIWKKIQELMASQIGGLNRSIFSKVPLPEEARGPFAPFGKTDQDAMNAAVEAYDGPVSFVGQEGMAFKAGVPQMTHALGSPKPWKSQNIVSALAGRPPRRVDRDYWSSVDFPIRCHSKSTILYKKIGVQIAAFMGRFYKRN